MHVGKWITLLEGNPAGLFLQPTVSVHAWWSICRLLEMYPTREAVFYREIWNTMCIGVLPRCLVALEILSGVFDSVLNRNIKQRSKRGSKIVKICANQDWVSKPSSRLWFSLFQVDEFTVNEFEISYTLLGFLLSFLHFTFDWYLTVTILLFSFTHYTLTCCYYHLLGPIHYNLSVT